MPQMRLARIGRSDVRIVDIYGFVKHVEGFSQAPPHVQAALYRSRTHPPTSSGWAALRRI
jgi:hypothetical protein